jgi:hypothetical protein
MKIFNMTEKNSGEKRAEGRGRGTRSAQRWQEG